MRRRGGRTKSRAQIPSQLTADTAQLATKQIDRKSSEIFIIEIRAAGGNVGDVLQGKRTSGS